MKIVIAGYGVEGRSSFAYFRRNYPAADIVIADENSVTDALEGVEALSGEGVFARLYDADLVVRTASLPPQNIQTNGKIWSATNEFFAKCPAPIIGVTGTKGKGTTASLIAAILRAAGKTVHLVGNIGVPALDVLPEVGSDDIVVYELSSFQLWDLEKSPHVAVVLMIEPDHLDVHASFEDYLEAKGNIRRYQGVQDICIYHPTNKYSEAIAGMRRRDLYDENLKCCQEQCEEYDDCGRCRFSSFEGAYRYGVDSEDQVYIKDGFFCVQGRKICATDNLKLPGQHNLENTCAAMSAVLELDGVKVSDEQFAVGLADFTGLPHRLNFVADKNGVKFYDDSISTTPGSAIAALKSFDDPKILILGGHDKGADYIELARELATSASLKSVILIGSNSDKMNAILRENGLSESKIVAKGMIEMTEVVKTAAAIAESGDIIILSPAAASFDQYKNYADRGEKFVDAVDQLK